MAVADVRRTPTEQSGMRAQSRFRASFAARVFRITSRGSARMAADRSACACAAVVAAAEEAEEEEEEEEEADEDEEDASDGASAGGSRRYTKATSAVSTSCISFPLSSDRRGWSAAAACASGGADMDDREMSEEIRSVRVSLQGMQESRSGVPRPSKIPIVVAS